MEVARQKIHSKKIILFLVLFIVGIFALIITNKVIKMNKESSVVENQYDLYELQSITLSEALENMLNQIDSYYKVPIANIGVKIDGNYSGIYSCNEDNIKKYFTKLLNNVEVFLDVPIINQHEHGLMYGCESMATLMALEYKTNESFDRYSFGISIPHDDTPVKTTYGYSGVYEWGDPSVGFVGDITGNQMGSTIDPEPLIDHLIQMGYSAKDISNQGTDVIIKQLLNGNPVVVWGSIDMNTYDIWQNWVTPDGKEIRVTFYAHSVTITGVDEQYFYYNDSHTGLKNQKVSKEKFEEVYNWRGQKAFVIE